jgi:hypothetical protein
VLAERRAVDPAAAVADYVPEVAGTGYDGVTVRQLLDMRTGVEFREAYTDADAEVRVMERSIGWRPVQPDDPIGIYRFLCSLRASGPHGGTFVYRSADTDLLGWVCERVSGTRMADLISELLWRPLGAECDAEITCDPLGTAVHDGGVSAAARDLLRFGLMLLGTGRFADRQVVPASWLADAYSPSDDVRSAFAASSDEPFFPGGWYRNQFCSSGTSGRHIAVPRHPRPDGVRRSGYRNRRGQAVQLAGRSEPVLPRRYDPGLHRNRDATRRSGPSRGPTIDATQPDVSATVHRLQNQVHLHRNRAVRCPASDLFGIKDQLAGLRSSSPDDGSRAVLRGSWTSGRGAGPDRCRPRPRHLAETTSIG